MRYKLLFLDRVFILKVINDVILNISITMNYFLSFKDFISSFMYILCSVFTIIFFFSEFLIIH